jgi:hypothetical protein
MLESIDVESNTVSKRALYPYSSILGMVFVLETGVSQPGGWDVLRIYAE